jgi:hypothetical protein
MDKVKSNTWIVFTFIGFLFIGWGLHQIFVIPTYTDHWAWLSTGDPEIWDYIKHRFQNHGVWTAANGLFILLVAVTGLRNRERWAWWTLTYVPVHILLLTIHFYWLFFITIPLMLITAWALWASRSDLQPGLSNRRGIGWLILFGVGLLFLYFAYDAFFVIPALDVRDPNRGWAWLTTDPEIIDYIKFYFRIYGIRVFGFAVMALLATFYGLREGYRSAWKTLWLVPLLVLVHPFLWPWLTPILIGIALLAGVGLGLAYPIKNVSQNG